MKYNTLFFDFDGTVMDTVGAIILSITDTFDRYGFPIPAEEEIKHNIGIPIQEIPYIVAQASAGGPSVDEIVDTYRRVFQEKYAKTHVKVFAGLKDLLLDLKERGVKMGIVSSKPTDPIHMSLRDTGMEGIFDVVVGSDLVRHYKPLPETVFLCAHQIGLADARQALVIGDAIHDIEMGQRAGMHTCAVPWGAGTEAALAAVNPTYFPKTLADLSELLKG